MSEEQKRAAKIQALKDRQAKGKGQPPKSNAPAKVEKQLSKKATMMEKYGAKNSITEEEKRSLDKSNANEADETLGRSVSMKIHMGSGKVDLDAVESSDDEAEQAGASAKPSGIWGFISKLTGTKELDQADIEATIAQFKESLMAKNVAVEIADKLCDSVSEGLIGTKKGAFTTMRAKIRDALEASLLKILTPKRSIDVLRDIEAANNTERRPCDRCTTPNPALPRHALCWGGRHRLHSADCRGRALRPPQRRVLPVSSAEGAARGATAGDARRSVALCGRYVIAFIGVNGVGKSTNLAKVAFWLKQVSPRACTLRTQCA
jgi:signal recognition particle GTPase